MVKDKETSSNPCDSAQRGNSSLLERCQCKGLSRLLDVAGLENGSSTSILHWNTRKPQNS